MVTSAGFVMMERVESIKVFFAVKDIRFRSGSTPSTCDNNG